MSIQQDFQASLKPTYFINYEHEVVQEFIQDHSVETKDLNKRAIQLYYAVRDQIRYDPYTFSKEPKGFKASEVIKSGKAWCVPKAILYAACCRRIGVPAQLGFADVRNHLSTARMRASMQTDIFYWHGYTVVYLHDKWVKATPAFNIELTEKFQLKPLEFNGLEDSIYHAFDKEGRQHMEYLHDRGVYEDLPLVEMVTDIKKLYPSYSETTDLGDFEADVEAEIIK